MEITDVEDITNRHLKHVLSVSGGKDSTALILHAIERGIDFRAVFADTGNEHEITIEYIEYLQDKLGIEIETIKADFSEHVINARDKILNNWTIDKTISVMGGRKKFLPAANQEDIDAALEMLTPTGNQFLDLCLSQGRMPSSLGRFCSILLKQAPFFDQVANPLINGGYIVVSWQGVRADESRNRSSYEPVLFDNGIITYRPILLWGVEDVFSIHKRFGIDPNPLYKMGMSRVGCMPCIHCRKGELKEIAKRFPEHVERIHQWEEMVGTVCRDPVIRKTGAEFLSRTDTKVLGSGRIKERVKWATTDRQGQVNFCTMLEDEEFDETACSAVYPMVCE